MKQFFKDLVHNCIIHPMLPFLPARIGNAIHNRNATWAFGPIDRAAGEVTELEAEAKQ